MQSFNNLTDYFNSFGNTYASPQAMTANQISSAPDVSSYLSNIKPNNNSWVQPQAATPVATPSQATPASPQPIPQPTPTPTNPLVNNSIAPTTPTVPQPRTPQPRVATPSPQPKAPSIADDWRNWFSSANDGVYDKWGGTLRKEGDRAFWTSADGVKGNALSANADPGNMYNLAMFIPELYKTWRQKYGQEAINALAGVDPRGRTLPGNPGFDGQDWIGIDGTGNPPGTEISDPDPPPAGQNRTPVGDNMFTTPGTSDPNIQGYIDTLSQSIPNFFQTFENAMSLPGQVDQWANNAINSQRITNDQIKNVLGTVANQYAGSGIGGGTQYDNALGSGLSELGKAVNTNKQNILANAMGTKANIISQMPSMAMQPLNAMINLSSLNSADKQGWANIAANIINGGY